MKIAIYAGAFDPPTLAHLEIRNQAALIFDKVVIAVAQNGAKGRGLLTPEQRVEAWKLQTSSDVVIVPPSKTIIDLMKLLKTNWVVRGLRGPEDVAPEMAYGEFVRKGHALQDDGCPAEVAYFMTPLAMSTISSTAVRSLIGLDNWREYVVQQKWVSSDVAHYIQKVINSQRPVHERG